MDFSLKSFQWRLFHLNSLKKFIEKFQQLHSKRLGSSKLEVYRKLFCSRFWKKKVFIAKSSRISGSSRTNTAEIPLEKSSKIIVNREYLWPKINVCHFRPQKTVTASCSLFSPWFHFYGSKVEPIGGRADGSLVTIWLLIAIARLMINNNSYIILWQNFCDKSCITGTHPALLCCFLLS